jgi:hypothetical protein
MFHGAGHGQPLSHPQLDEKEGSVKMQRAALEAGGLDSGDTTATGMCIGNSHFWFWGKGT